MPIDDQAFLAKLLGTFRIEAEEHIQAIISGLVELEQTTAPERRTDVIETIFREAHSLKGAARSVNLGKVESLCQLLESSFAALKAQPDSLSPELFDRIHRMVAAASAEIAPAGGGPSQPVESAKPARQILPSATATPAETVRPSSAERPALPDTVRVSSSKLTAILRQAEELITSKATAAHRLSELHSLNRAVQSWEREWTKVRPHLRAEQRSVERRTGKDSANASLAMAPLFSFLDRNENALQAIKNQIVALGSSLDGDRRALDRKVGDLLDDIKRMSVLPFSLILAGFPKLVRDLSRDCGKDADLVIRGGEIEAGRQILDEIKDPLMHLIRNCIDHGIGTPAERRQNGKPERGTITIAITPKSGGKVELAVSDDGSGIDAKKIAAAAARQGLMPPDENNGKDESAALALIFKSGFSTSAMLTEVSGRGLGLAIVREKIEGLGGKVWVETKVGIGTTFRLLLPLTLATFRGVLVRAGGDLFIIPTMHVKRVLRVAPDQIKSVENRPAIEFEHQVISLVWLSEALGIADGPAGANAKQKRQGLVLDLAGEQIAFLVDEVLYDQEVLVKGLGNQLVHVRNIAGAAVLETGVVAPVLNVPDLMRSAAGITPSAEPIQPDAQLKSILVVEDSITSRTLLKGILESSGYLVTTAVNGAEAFSILEKQTPDLVVSDVEMPRMSGFDLTAKIRANRRLADVPVVLVTALDSREDRERGADVGANAYIVKSSFDQSNLLDVVQRLI